MFTLASVEIDAPPPQRDRRWRAALSSHDPGSPAAGTVAGPPTLEDHHVLRAARAREVRSPATDGPGADDHEVGAVVPHLPSGLSPEARRLTFSHAFNQEPNRALRAGRFALHLRDRDWLVAPDTASLPARARCLIRSAGRHRWRLPFRAGDRAMAGGPAGGTLRTPEDDGDRPGRGRRRVDQLPAAAIGRMAHRPALCAGPGLRRGHSRTACVGRR